MDTRITNKDIEGHLARNLTYLRYLGKEHANTRVSLSELLVQSQQTRTTHTFDTLIQTVSKFLCFTQKCSTALIQSTQISVESTKTLIAYHEQWTGYAALWN